MPKILVSDKLSDRGLSLLKGATGLQVLVKTGLTPEQLGKEVRSCDGLVIRSATKVTREIIEAADSLKVIARAGIGVDNVD